MNPEALTIKLAALKLAILVPVRNFHVYEVELLKPVAVEVIFTVTLPEAGRVIAPLLVRRSQLVPAVPVSADMSIVYIAPADHVCAPVFKLPTEPLPAAPGDTAPLIAKVPDAVPVPPRVAPEQHYLKQDFL